MEKTTVFYDGSCALCRAEMCHYRKQDKVQALRFIDVSDVGMPLPVGIDRAQAMKLFHVLSDAGTVLTGAPAFVEVWAQLPRWRWLAIVRKSTVVMVILNGAYRLFLPLRPRISRLFGKLSEA